MPAVAPAAVGRDAARQLLKSLPEKHRQGRADLLRQHREQYAAWSLELAQGFSLCFYGYGSKQAMLEVGHTDTLRCQRLAKRAGWQPR